MCKSMTEKTLSEKLRSLANDDLTRSKSARLRDVFDDVELALSAGVSKEKILNQLAEDGLNFSMTTFNTTLQRLRAKRKNEAPSKPVSTTKTTSKTIGEKPIITPEEPQAEEVILGSHKPEDLNAIIGSTPDLDALAKLGKSNKQRNK